MTETRTEAGPAVGHLYTPTQQVQAVQWFKLGDHDSVVPVPEGNYGDVPGPFQAEQCGWIWATVPAAPLPGGGAGPAGSVVKPGDYVVGPEASGAYWPCDQADFEVRYEAVEPAPSRAEKEEPVKAQRREPSAREPSAPMRSDTR